MKRPKERLAVVLMNLGGPDTLDAVRPFLKNLFSDPAIIRLPWPIRPLVAEMISRTRTQKSRKIYQQMGGESPLLANTKLQQVKLCQLLRDQLPEQAIEVFIAMRYWHPLTQEAVGRVKAFQPTQVVLLPLYPQFSTTTTGSSFTEWYKQASLQGLTAPTREVRSYPQDPDFIEAHVDLVRPLIEEASIYGKPRILFSAHGLPQKVIDAGDPYENQVHQTIEAILKKIPSDVEGVVCYQSKVGPLKWLGPSIDQELKRAAEEKAPVIVVPVAFVSEHSETLVELDRDYRSLAMGMGIPFYGRVATLSDHPAYIRSLAGLVIENPKKG
jgi:ferrochelatase